MSAITEKINEFTNTASERYVEVNDKFLDAVVDANRKAVSAAVKVSDTVSERIDALEVPNVDLPKIDLPKMDLPKIDLPNVDLPKIDLPTAEEAGERYIAFVERAVEMNRDYRNRVVEMISTDVAAPAPAPKAAPKKRTTKKATAKRATAKKATAKRTTKAAAKS